MRVCAHTHTHAKTHTSWFTDGINFINDNYKHVTMATMFLPCFAGNLKMTPAVTVTCRNTTHYIPYIANC